MWNRHRDRAEGYAGVPLSGAMVAVGLLALLCGMSAELAAQDSRCADCHFAHPEAPYQSHLMDWQVSAHGRAEVGCESCHGGVADTYDELRAHDGVLSSGNPASPVHPSRLAATCGSCHPGQLVAFRKSSHHDLTEKGITGGPTCATCHGSVAAFLLSSRGLERRCRSCHGEGEKAPRSMFPVAARQLHEQVTEVREGLRAASKMIGKVRDRERQRELRTLYEQAEAPLTEVVESAHSFSFALATERLGVARRRTTALIERLANP